jgi:hypothetical protein
LGLASEQAFDIFTGFLSADGGATFGTALQLAGTTETHPLIQQMQEMISGQGISTSEFGMLAVGLYISQQDAVVYAAV